MGVSAEDILFRARRRLKEARALYAETYGRAVDDPASEAELDQILQKHNFSRSGDVVPVPAELLLAFVLRPRGRGQGRKRPPKEALVKHLNARAVSDASIDWARRIAAGESSKRAKHNAAVKARARTYGCDLSINTIKLRMRLAKGRLSFKKRRSAGLEK